MSSELILPYWAILIGGNIVVGMISPNVIAAIAGSICYTGFVMLAFNYVK